MKATQLILDIMEKRGLTRQLIAMHMGKNRTSISKYIDNPSELKIEDFLKLCEVLKCDPLDIMKNIVEESEYNF